MQLKNFEVIGIYNADAGLLGELKYLTRKAMKNEICDLCDLTHGWNPFGKRKWKRALAKSGIGITFLHRNQASNNHKKASGLLPAIISNVTGEWECLVSNAALKQYKNNPEEIYKQTARSLAQESSDRRRAQIKADDHYRNVPGRSRYYVRSCDANIDNNRTR